MDRGELVWQLETAPAFDRAARKMDRQDVQKIRRYLEEVCQLENPRLRGKGLTGSLSGYWRYRVGDYRILVEIRDRELVVVAIGVGHRSTVYRQHR